MFFEDFFGGGMPGGGSMRREETDTDALYETLGVEKNATHKEIKRAWRKLARKHHPDRPDGDAEQFKKCEEAHNVLSDPDKRALYDEGGLDAVKSGHSGPTNIFDLFGGGRSQRERGPKKPAPIKQLVEINLEDIVSGSSKKNVTVSVLSADEKVSCTQCHGRGHYMERIHRGHMVLQAQKTCPRCDGKGISFKNEKKTDKRLEVYIPAGIRDGDKHVIEGEGHDLPDMPTGDVVIIFKIRPHRVFTRMGADLAMVKELTLVEALCGYDFYVRSIVQNEWLRVQNEEGGIMQHGDVIKIEEQGLPQKGNRGHGIKGNLYIKFHVVLPESGSLNTTTLGNLESILSSETCTYEMGNTESKAPEISVGSRVKLIGLQNRPDLNGVEGVVIQENIRPGQYAVQLVTDQTVAVRDELLELLDVEPEEEEVVAPADDDFISEVRGTKVDDMERVRHTPADFGSIHDDDEMEDEGVGCRQM